jgi:tellurite resistance protein
MGYQDLVVAILAVTLLIAGVIYAVSLAQLGKQGPPPPLRPLQAIHLAPMALFGQAAHLLGLEVTAVIFAVFANVVLAVLLWRARYLTKAGFSPLWGAFTFPLAAYSGLMLALWQVSEVFLVLGGLSLVAATLVIPAIAAKVLQLWAKGVLAAKTNAAVA